MWIGWTVPAPLRFTNFYAAIVRAMQALAADGISANWLQFAAPGQS